MMQSQELTAFLTVYCYNIMIQIYAGQAYDVRCKLMVPATAHDQLYCQKFFEFLTFFKNPSLSEGILLSFVKFKELDTSVHNKKRFVLYLVRQNEINDNNLLYKLFKSKQKQIKDAI